MLAKVMNYLNNKIQYCNMWYVAFPLYCATPPHTHTHKHKTQTHTHTSNEELHMSTHLPRFSYNKTLLYLILSF